MFIYSSFFLPILHVQMQTNDNLLPILDVSEPDQSLSLSSWYFAATLLARPFFKGMSS